jgi:hypothetical protein
VAIHIFSHIIIIIIAHCPFGKLLQGISKVVPLFNWLCTTSATVTGTARIAPHILSFDTRWKWVVSFPSRLLFSGERARGTHFIGGWISTTADLGAVDESTILCSCRTSNLDSSVILVIICRYTDWDTYFNIWYQT